MNTTALLPFAITAGLVYAAWKFGSPEIRGMALGVGGLMLINQIPMARDGLNVRLVA
jgi:hypothetical protein